MKLYVQFCIQSINVYKNEFTRIYIKIKLNINERGKKCSKCPTCNLQYSGIFVEIRSSTCHQSILGQQKYQEWAHAKQNKSKRENDIKVGKIRSNQNKYSSLIIISLNELIQLISFILMGTN